MDFTDSVDSNDDGLTLILYSVLAIVSIIITVFCSVVVGVVYLGKTPLWSDCRLVYLSPLVSQAEVREKVSKTTHSRRKSSYSIKAKVAKHR